MSTKIKLKNLGRNQLLLIASIKLTNLNIITSIYFRLVCGGKFSILSIRRSILRYLLMGKLAVVRPIHYLVIKIRIKIK